ncbi:MAG: hypothetical protein ACE5NG_01130, partial [bacterium]
MLSNQPVNLILFTLFWVLCGIAELVFAQSQQKYKAISFYPGYSKLSFSQDLNIYKWKYTLNYLKELKNQLEIKIAEDFNSTLQ